MPEWQSVQSSLACTECASAAGSTVGTWRGAWQLLQLSPAGTSGCVGVAAATVGAVSRFATLAMAVAEKLSIAANSSQRQIDPGVVLRFRLVLFRQLMCHALVAVYAGLAGLGDVFG